jgi:hypothetical protein
MTTAPAPRRTRRAWLVAAALLLAGSAALLALVEDEGPRPTRPAVRFPSHMRAAEEERLEARRTLPPLPPQDGPPPPGEPPPAPAQRDPFLAALPAGPGDAVVVFEANALRHSRLGELFLRCALARDPGTFTRIEEETGIDVLKDIDRVAVAGDALVVSGFFDRAHWERLEQRGATASPLGEAGRLWRGPGAGGGGALASWGDQLLVLSRDEASARRAIDQLEGRAPAQAPALPEELSYGEVYGVVPGSALRRLLGPGQGALGERLAAAASRVELHVDAMQDVAAVVRVEGEDGAALSELARTLGGALAAGRLEAKAKGEGELVELLDAARVLTDDGRFSVELALPQELLERWFERCAEQAGTGEASP